MALTINSLEVAVAPDGHKIRYEPLGTIERIYDGTMRSAITTQRGYVRVHTFRTPELDNADIDAIIAEIDGPGSVAVSDDHVGSAVTCHPGSWTRTPAVDPRESSLVLDLRESTTVAGDRKEYVRVMVADAADVLQDMSEWFVGATVTASLEQLAKTASVTFWRETATESIAPLMTSPVPIDAGRRLWIDVAVVALGVTPDSPDWVPLFRGTIDDPEWGTSRSQLTVSCRDYAKRLDQWIKTPAEYGNSIVPVAIETVMQAILDDVLGVGEETLYVIGDPDFGIVLYTQDRMSLASALGELRDLIGWDLRYLWNDAQDDYVLTLYEPDVLQTTPNHIYDTDDYFEITRLERTSVGIRNYIEVAYDPDGTLPNEIAIDSGSVAEFGEQYMYMDETRNNLINNAASAQALGAAILRDTSRPPLSHVAENALDPTVELGRLCRYTANDVHYSADQDVSVLSYTHALSPDGNSTSIEARGQPGGGVTRWFQRFEKRQRENEIDDTTTFSPTITTDDLLILYTTNQSGVTQGYTVASTPSESLGGWISTTEVATGKNGLFRDVTEAERVAGITLYRSVAFVNRSTAPVPKTWECVKGYFSDIGVSGDYLWEMALDPAGVVPVQDDTIQSCVSADEETEPDCSPALTWVSPADWDDVDAADVGDVAAQYGFVVHLRLVVTAGATNVLTDETYVFRNGIPQAA